MRLPVTLSAFFAFVLFLASCGDSTAELLAERGVEADATITFKQENGGKRNVRGAMFFTLYYFAKDSAALAEDEKQDKIISDTSMSMIDRLDKWDPMAGGLGEFMSVELKVPSNIFDKYEAGDRVKVLYLPEDPKTVLLEEQVGE